MRKFITTYSQDYNETFSEFNLNYDISFQYNRLASICKGLNVHLTFILNSDFYNIKQFHNSDHNFNRFLRSTEPCTMTRWTSAASRSSTSDITSTTRPTLEWWSVTAATGRWRFTCQPFSRTGSTGSVETSMNPKTTTESFLTELFQHREVRLMMLQNKSETAGFIWMMMTENFLRE